MTDIVDFVVDRKDLRTSRFVRHPSPELAPGQVLVRVDVFAFTANNVSYAVVGEQLGYWQFFPAGEGEGRIPVWGFGQVVESRHDAVPEGERLFGYFPMSSHVVLEPKSVSSGSLVDGTKHRQDLPAIYNQYLRTARDPLYDAKTEDLQMLLRPLFLTSFLIDDFLADEDFLGARQVVLSSASSKTAFSLAFLLSARDSHPQVVGLTSPGNASFVEGLGCYDQVVPYEGIGSLRSDPAVFVDMAGNRNVLEAVHRHFGEQLKYSCLVGATHWEASAPPGEIPGPHPTFFFAPTQMEKRQADWGPAGLQERIVRAWRSFVPWAGERLQVRHGRGDSAVEQAYRETLEGRTAPNEGHILSLNS